MVNKLEKHKRRFKIYNIISIILSVLITFFLFMFMYGWAKGDGNEVSFTITSYFIFIGVAFGFYLSLLLPGYLLHKILIMKDKKNLKKD